MMQYVIVIAEQRADRLCCMLYKPGFMPQAEIERAGLRELLKSEAPPLLMFLEHGHFNALVPISSAFVKEEVERASGKRKANAIEV